MRPVYTQQTPQSQMDIVPRVSIFSSSFIK
jgi:hypothetical protein